MRRGRLAAGMGSVALAAVLLGCQASSATQDASPTAPPEPDRTVSPSEATGEATSVFDLAVGDCFSASGSQLSEVVVVSCEQPHVYEAFAVVDHPAAADAAYPGDDAINIAAVDACRASFEDYVGVDYESSRWFMTNLTPSEGTWAQGDREIVCTLALEDETEVTDSARGSAE